MQKFRVWQRWTNSQRWNRGGTEVVQRWCRGSGEVAEVVLAQVQVQVLMQVQRRRGADAEVLSGCRSSGFSRGGGAEVEQR